MKKRKIITLGLLMATCFMQSCDSTPSSTVIQDPTENIEKALIKARETVNFNGNITAIYVDDGDTYNEGELDFSITDSFMEWKKHLMIFLEILLIMIIHFLKMMIIKWPIKN